MMKYDILYIYLVSLLLLWSLGGFLIICLAWVRKKAIERTLQASYQCVPMEVLDVNIIPNYLYGDTAIYPLNERNSSILIRYKYTWNGKIYESRRIFPIEMEWMKPRISSFSLLNELKTRHLNKCFVDSLNPSQAVLFRGWSPHLKQHVIGLFISGALIIFVGILLWQFL